MHRPLRTPSWPVGAIVTALALAVWCGLAAPPTVAAESGPATLRVSAAAPPAGPQLVHAPLFAGFIDRFLGFFEGNLANQRRMLQFGLVMMLLGLWIIWWRKS